MGKNSIKYGDMPGGYDRWKAAWWGGEIYVVLEWFVRTGVKQTAVCKRVGGGGGGV